MSTENQPLNPEAPGGSGYPPHQPPYQQYQPAPPTNGFAIASLVTSICGFSILGVIFGHISLKQIRESNGTEGGYGLGLAGTIIGWVGIGFGVLVVVWVLIALLVTGVSLPFFLEWFEAIDIDSGSFESDF